MGNTGINRRARRRGVIVLVALAACAQASPAFAQLSCGNVYASHFNGSIYTTADNGTQTLAGSLTGEGSVNAFGIAPAGNQAYLVRPNGAVVTFDTTTFATTSISPAPTLTGMGTPVGGAVNPVNGWFYAAGAPTAGDGSSWYLYAYNPATPAVAPVRVGTITGTSGTSGDITFDSQGNLFVVSGTSSSNVLSRVGQVPTAAGNATLPATALTTLTSTGSQVTGIAFNATGELMVAFTGASPILRRYNPVTGAVISSTTASAGGPISDLASCAGASTLTLRKNLPQGRLPGPPPLGTLNQFTLQLSGGGLAAPLSATTAGNASGVQPQVVGPIVAADGTTFTLNEAAAGSTNLASYARSWECRDEANGNALVASGATFPGTVTIPSGTTESSVVCTITNAQAPIIRLQKALPDGRAIAGNQFLLRIAGGVGADITTTTTGATTAPTQVATLDPAVPGTTYTLSESAAGSPLTVMGNYSTSYSCLNALAGGQTPSGSGASFTIVPAAGDDLTCTFRNARLQTDLRIVKTATSGTVPAGGLAQFSLVVSNQGPAAANGAVVNDPALPGLDCTAAGLPAPTCSATSGASCPASLTAAGMQSGVAIPLLPNGGVVTFGLTCRVTASGF